MLTTTLSKPSGEQAPSIPPSIRNAEEEQYLDLIRLILDRGEVRKDRTGTGTKGLFGHQMRFSLQHHVYPLLTTKRVFYRGVVEELLWFIRGETNANLLKEKNIHIWDGHGSQTYLRSLGLDREEGDLGPVYGFQWRHFGAPYMTMQDSYKDKGVDQLTQLIENIKHHPYDRRHILTAWNPMALSEMALPPCHLLCQFYVSASGLLSCQLYQRSSDVGLGLPFNIASYALLTIIMAFVTGLAPGELVISIGDAHIYLDHVETLQTQTERIPGPFPTLRIRPDCTHTHPEQFVLEDFILEGYHPQGKLEMKMSV